MYTSLLEVAGTILESSPVKANQVRLHKLLQRQTHLFCMGQLYTSARLHVSNYVGSLEDEGLYLQHLSESLDSNWRPRSL
jgi:hypothetical protein